MNFQNRNKDLTEVFNQRYNANHNYNNIKQNIDNNRNFMNKMYGVKDNSVNNRQPVLSTREATIQRLNEKMSALNNNKLNK